MNTYYFLPLIVSISYILISKILLSEEETSFFSISREVFLLSIFNYLLAFALYNTKSFSQVAPTSTVFSDSIIPGPPKFSQF
jgi:hypothetical protein